MLRTYKRRVLPSTPAQMINRPTVIPAIGVEGQGLPSVPTDPFYAIGVKTSGATERQKVVLFDAGGGYQLGTETTSGVNVAIEGITAPYQFIMNDVVHNGSFVNLLKMNIVPLDPTSVAASVALKQYAHPIKIYTSSKGSEPRLLRTIHPSMGVNSQQYHYELNTFEVNLLFDNRTAMVYTQEPGVELVWSFYQTAEVGRIQ